MNKKQYNNVIDYTLKHEQSAQTEDSLATARAIFNNMGVALPAGNMQEVYDTIKNNDYMGWRSCTMQEAQAAADNGTAAIGISEERIVVLSANDEEEPVTETAAVMTLSEDTSAFAVIGLEYYAYSAATTNSSERYYRHIHNTSLMYPSNGTTYCNIWAHRVLDACGVPYATGGCTAELRQYESYSISGWSECTYLAAQVHANNGRPAIGIEPSHMVIVTPNNVNGNGAYPTSIAQVLVSQSGTDCFYDRPLSYSWTANDRDKVKFFYYNRSV